MNTDAAALAAAIGTRVRDERMSLGWTLDRLAQVAGISRRAVVNVEQGAANPSVGTLLRLSDALGIGLPDLVEPPGPTVTVTRCADRAAVLWTGERGGRGVLVAGTSAPDVVELWVWTLAPGEARRSEAHSRNTRELIHVHEGVLSVEVAEETYSLGAGDGLSYGADASHAYVNAGGEWVRFSLAVFEPGVSTRRHADGAPPVLG